MRVKKEFMIRTVAGQEVIVATGEAAMKYNGLLTVSPTGAFLLKHYADAENFEDLVRMVLEEFDVDYETAASDAAGFTQAMLEAGMIEMSDEKEGW